MIAQSWDPFLGFNQAIDGFILGKVPYQVRKSQIRLVQNIAQTIFGECIPEIGVE